ncbi:MAG: Uma2 family endonuclease [Pirellulales bacterium]
MAQSIPQSSVWTLADLVDLLGPIPAHRIRHSPPPGAATQQDVVRLERQEQRLYELVEGVLVEKAMGFYESYLAGVLVKLIGNYLDRNNLGIVTPPDGMVCLRPGLVRIPDVAFISWERLPGRAIPRDPIPNVAPDLAVEILSEGNTEQEMRRKLNDYFAARVRRVWYVDPASRSVTVYTSPAAFTVLHEHETLDGGDVLPGFRLPLDTFFGQRG